MRVRGDFAAGREVRPKDLTPAEYLGIIWHYLGHGKWGPPSESQVALAEAIASPEHDRMVVCMFRGAGKSTVTAAMLTRFWVFDPTMILGVVAAEADLAEKITGQVREILSLVPMLRNLRPNAKARNRRGGFDIGASNAEQTQSMWGRGIFGNFTGCRADFVLFDDIEVPNNCDSQGNREKLWNAANEAGNLLRPSGLKRIQFNGTPHADNSIYWKLLREKAGYKMLVWPARLPSEDQERFHGANLHPRIRAALMDPAKRRGDPTDRRFDEAELRRKLIDVGGQSNFDRQFQLDPRVADAQRYPLKNADLFVMDLDVRSGPKSCVYGRVSPIEGVDHVNVGFDGDHFYAPLNLKGMEYALYEDKCMFIDPSGQGVDETAYLVAGWVHGYLCILDWGGNTMWGDVSAGYSEETLARLVAKAIEWECPRIMVENRNVGPLLTAMLQKHIRASGKNIGVVQIPVPGNSKGKRMLGLIQPFAEQHRLVLNRKIIESDYESGGRGKNASLAAYRALYQYTHMTIVGEELVHDDRLDVLSLACLHWKERAAVDANAALLRLEEEEIRKQYERMMPDGSKPKPGNGVPSRGGAARIAMQGYGRAFGRMGASSPTTPNNPWLRQRGIER